MGNINLSELNSDGLELFSDSENYLSEMSEQELMDTFGGGITKTILTTALTVGNMIKESINPEPGDLALPSVDVNFGSSFSSSTGIPSSTFTDAGSFGFASGVRF